MDSHKLRELIRARYAWPGGYPMFGVMDDGGCLCMTCLRSEYKQIAYSNRHKLNDGWNVSEVVINYEDPNLTCDHCGEQIESAYGDDDDE